MSCSSGSPASTFPRLAVWPAMWRATPSQPARPQSSPRKGVMLSGPEALAATALTAQPALASANVEGLLQNVVDMLTGNTARLLAVLAVVVVGILWMFGLFDLRRAAIVVLGIVVVFGAAEIVNLITGGS